MNGAKGKRMKIDPLETFNPRDVGIKHDIVKLIKDWLSLEGFTGTVQTLGDELGSQNKEEAYYAEAEGKIRLAILNGNWDVVVEKAKTLLKRNQQSLHYVVYRQHFLELVDRQEIQKAFTILTKKLKPLESFINTQASYSSREGTGEFHDLCYLLTCKSVQEAERFKNWGNVARSRERLSAFVSSLLQQELQINRLLSNQVNTYPFLEQRRIQRLYNENRLISLLQQAMAYQVEISNEYVKNEATVSIDSLLYDYSSKIMPNKQHTKYIGHTKNVKCLTFVGKHLLASGSSDSTINLYKIDKQDDYGHGAPIETIKLDGYNGRIWDIDTNSIGNLLSCVGSDNRIRIYDLLHDKDGNIYSPLIENTKKKREPYIIENENSSGDLYCVKFQDDNAHIATGGYDNVCRIFDIETGKNTQTFFGHSKAVTQTIFTPALIITASKDSTIKFWDAVSGSCVNTIKLLNEVCSIEVNKNFTELLTSSKDSSIKLFDFKTGKVLRRYKGHQNSSRNFIRASYGPKEDVIMSGSEDGSIYFWDKNSETVMERLKKCHLGPVFRTIYNPYIGMMASCGNDGIVKTFSN
jgi:COMPASS component SWD3